MMCVTCWCCCYVCSGVCPPVQFGAKHPLVSLHPQCSLSYLQTQRRRRQHAAMWQLWPRTPHPLSEAPPQGKQATPTVLAALIINHTDLSPLSVISPHYSWVQFLTVATRWIQKQNTVCEKVLTESFGSCLFTHSVLFVSVGSRGRLVLSRLSTQTEIQPRPVSSAIFYWWRRGRGGGQRRGRGGGRVWGGRRRVRRGGGGRGGRGSSEVSVKKFRWVRSTVVLRRSIQTRLI